MGMSLLVDTTQKVSLQDVNNIFRLKLIRIFDIFFFSSITLASKNLTLLGSSI